jgi:hypothetical protein
VDSTETQLSHAILNPATAALQGEVAYTRALARLTRSEKALHLLEQSKAVFEKTRTWWSEIAQGIPLVRKGPELTGDGRQVCEILEEALERWERLAERVERLGPEAVDRGDAEALRFLVAASADHAFYAYQIVTGTIAASKMMGDALADGRGAGRVAECMDDVRQMNAIVDQLADAGDLVGEHRDVLAGRVLALPVELRLRIVDARHALGLVRGRSDYPDLGIPENETEEWKRHGLVPFIAARWRAAGFPPSEAVEWAKARLDPATAGVYRRQGVTLDQLRQPPVSKP